MKSRLLVLGIFPLFIACNSSSEKNENADTLVKVDTIGSTIAVSDTALAITATVASPAVDNSQTKPAAVKTQETAAPIKDKVVESVKSIPVAAVRDTKKGEVLISKSDCFACHKVNEKLLGPAYHDVANKYPDTEANIDYLVKKIKSGGSGVWGAIPMSPHPALSDEDAEAMVHYILSLK